MPQVYKGRRISVTARLPLDLYGEVVSAAKARRWTINEFMTYAAEGAVGRRNRDRHLDPTPSVVAPIEVTHLVAAEP